MSPVPAMQSRRGRVMCSGCGCRVGVITVYLDPDHRPDDHLEAGHSFTWDRRNVEAVTSVQSTPQKVAAQAGRPMRERSVPPVVGSLGSVNGEQPTDTIHLTCRRCKTRKGVSPTRVAKIAESVRNGRHLGQDPIYL
ncbi:MAG: hypothetical protein KDC39_15875 [Actinobacteria bacterium]|nr:hypothetical protein [Actinomycetota bacterium]